MTRLSLKWSLVFCCLILLPVAALTYLSIQSLTDERQSVLEEQQLLASLLQDGLEQLVGRITAEIAYTEPQALNPPAYTSFAEVQAVFITDPAGDFIYPPVLPLRLAERPAAVDAGLQQAALLEFRQQDSGAAMALYRKLLQQTENAPAQAEILNALGRSAVRANNMALAVEVQSRLSHYQFTLDADGAHPSTLHTLRLARYWGHGRGSALLEAALRQIIAGQQPQHPGSQTALLEIQTMRDQWQQQGLDCAGLNTLLAQLDRRRVLMEEYTGILQRNTGKPAGYIAGLRPDSSSFFGYIRPSPQGDTAGLLFNLDRLHQTLSRSQASRRLAERGFAFSLFAAEQTEAFTEKFRYTVHLVEAAGKCTGTLRLGIYATDQSIALSDYRRRNLLLLGGIFVLAGVVSLGGYMILRDSSRELRLAQLRSEFVANVSHELRTPLAAIRMNAETLATGRYRSPDKRDSLLDNVMRESERLSRLVDNILTFSRIESGRKSYNFKETAPEQVVRAALEPFEAALAAGGFTWQVDIAADLPLLKLDAEDVQIAVSNLISNAIKYSRQHREVNIRLEQQGRQVILAVADRGIGVPEADRQKIFDQFHRASNALDGSMAGTGVGLALTKSIMDAHGGRVELVDRKDGGSIFRLVFPLERTA